MEDQKSWQLEQPQGTPLYTVDAHSTQGMYVKRMLLINRRNLWQLAAAVALLLLYANSLSVLGFVLGILSIPFVFTMTRAVAVLRTKPPKALGVSSFTTRFTRIASRYKARIPKARSGMTTFTGSLCGKILSA
ncbi:hypothetical protein NIA69_15765 [Gemmiger formicilis]|nr:hypothetical protein [Gemmiger formicilis]